MNRAAIVNAGKSGKLGGKQMKLSRRGLISVVSALAATTMAFAAPARAADGKEIVYITPSLDLPFWRYLSRGVAGIAISPTDSSTAPSVLAAAARAKIPVVVADIGTNSGDYVSFIISDHQQGAFR